MKIKLKKPIPKIPGEVVGKRFIFVPRFCVNCRQYIWLGFVLKKRGKGIPEFKFLHCR